MKKFILTGFLLLSAVLMYGQKSKVNAAQNQANALPPELEKAEANIKEALQDPTSKDDAKTWYVAGYIYEKKIEEEQKKTITGGQDDKKVRGESVNKAYDYFLKAYDLDQLPDEKGKIKPKYDKDIVSYMKTFPPEFFNYGVLLYGEKDYKGAIDTWERYLNMPNLPFMKNQGIGADSDSLYIYTTFYTATASVLMDDHDKAIKYLEKVKDKYSINESYQLLSQQYLAKKDTVGYFNTIQKGFEKYPTNVFFLESLVNYYIYFNENVDGALNYLSEAIKVNPNMPQYYYVRGSIYEVKKDDEKALADFKKALSLDKNSAGANAGIGRYYYKKGEDQMDIANNTRDMKQAKVESDKAKEIYKEAVPYFEKAREQNPTDSDNLRLLKSLYYKIYQDENNANYKEIDAALKAL
ncbi:tetratricopeptide repeat protein [Bacteroidales bacterium OttesenSCG-928-I21]|nr:tetratricopeptide repeat protein [Bacteroidales bacterium OttesenSCG-928-I21]